jgi:hypothetical protein
MEGWMSHPFPLSSFKISNAEQIETIRSLGLKKVRWSPERSDLPPEPAATVRGHWPGHVRAGAGWKKDPAAKARRLADARAEAEQAALRVCERQYQEACPRSAPHQRFDRRRAGASPRRRPGADSRAARQDDGRQ